jgi:hypothetical protein
LTESLSARTWSTLAGLEISRIHTVGYRIAGFEQASDTATGQAMSGPKKGNALLAANELPPVLAPAAESATSSAAAEVTEPRQLMGFGARCTESGSRKVPICLTSKTALPPRQPHPTTLPHLVGLEAGGVVRKFNRPAENLTRSDRIRTEWQRHEPIAPGK